METRACQNCKNDFTIEPDDFSFYEKIGVPAPTFCPECRMIRRMLWRNSRSLHKRNCGLCEKSIVSMYKDTRAPVYCSECWNSDAWDQYQNAREYDFSQNFFVQLNEIFSINPRMYAYRFGNFVNSDYINYAKDDKNCYLSYSVINCEDILYSELADDSKLSVDCLSVINADNCYENINSDGNYNTHFAVNSQSCIDSYFLYDCANCSNCFMSSNLRNQKYVFRNQKLTKEAYAVEMEKLKLFSRAVLQQLAEEFDQLIKVYSVHKYTFSYAVENCTGDYIHNAKNAKFCFGAYDSENVSYGNRLLYVKDSMDMSGCGFGELIYESMAATQDTYHDSFCYITIQGCREYEYSLILKNCSNCFGCVGLTNASYCIFNKQYEKDEYFSMVEKIRSHMNEIPYIDENGRVYTYGEYFPFFMSPFGYNETNVQEYFPLSKEEAVKNGYPWFEGDKKNYKTTIHASDLPDSIHDVSTEIIAEIISCPNLGDQKKQCTGAYRITQEELQFYKRKNLPLPVCCPNCRHAKRTEKRNPMKLWRRSCMCNQSGHGHEGKCANEFETSYAPDRPEKVYCETCYQKEVL